MIRFQLVGPKSTTFPEAGLDTFARAGPLAQQITQTIITQNKDPNNYLLYNPRSWQWANGTHFPANYNWLQPIVNKFINGRRDSFSPR